MNQIGSVTESIEAVNMCSLAVPNGLPSTTSSSESRTSSVTSARTLAPRFRSLETLLVFLCNKQRIGVFKVSNRIFQLHEGLSCSESVRVAFMSR